LVSEEYFGTSEEIVLVVLFMDSSEVHNKKENFLKIKNLEL
jgi:hypothetical protein